MTTKRIVVGAHYGLKDWLAQRITAVVLAVYTVVLGLAVLAGPPLAQASWKVSSERWEAIRPKVMREPC